MWRDASDSRPVGKTGQSQCSHISSTLQEGDSTGARQGTWQRKPQRRADVAAFSFALEPEQDRGLGEASASRTHGRESQRQGVRMLVWKTMSDATDKILGRLASQVAKEMISARKSGGQQRVIIISRGRHRLGTQTKVLSDYRPKYNLNHARKGHSSQGCLTR